MILSQPGPRSNCSREISNHSFSSICTGLSILKVSRFQVWFPFSRRSRPSCPKVTLWRTSACPVHTAAHSTTARTQSRSSLAAAQRTRASTAQGTVLSPPSATPVTARTATAPSRLRIAWHPTMKAAGTPALVQFHPLWDAVHPTHAAARDARWKTSWPRE